MAKANIETSAGTKIVVEGNADEVAAIIASIRSKEQGMEIRRQHVEEKKGGKGTNSSLPNQILQLREEGFFNKPRKVIEVKQALDQKAHFYLFPTISTTLIRLVRKSDLGRVKTEKAWGYVKRG